MLFVNYLCSCAYKYISELLDMYEYHSLICLLCPDFPLSVVQQAARYNPFIMYM